MATAAHVKERLTWHIYIFASPHEAIADIVVLMSLV